MDEHRFQCNICGVVGEPIERELKFFARCTECGRIARFHAVPEPEHEIETQS